ncbi:sensor histidine kinase [Calothrix sp. 336/3]|uniref:sensor histidine kinase n=1 Tax=Calothrix sp. 336/3 TaxID=1337936 RepID=UPI0004E2C203|nr:ATP-binding protein [Calothrix sp. 336/3]AKG20594.1 ATPase [Calothrix sp. 336/3]
MASTEEEIKLKELEKQVRVLKKKLESSERDRRQLEDASEEREIILKNVIKELSESQSDLEKRGEELETALKNLQSLQLKLVESEKMSALGVMVAGIAHEINNPVNFIYGNLSHAQAYLEDLLELVSLYQEHFSPLPVEIQQFIHKIDLDFIAEDAQELFSSMNTGAERIQKIVISLRNFSRLDEAEFKTANIHEGLDNTLVILNHRLKSISSDEVEIKVVRDYGKLPLIQCYPGQLNQVFMNVLVNAIDALEEIIIQNNKSQINSDYLCLNSQYIPQIHIRTEAINDWALISIADNGKGMSEDIRLKIFDPFFTTKEVGKGTGLGLSSSYQIIVKQHGGKIDCKSNLGRGTEFMIQIPIPHIR